MPSPISAPSPTESHISSHHSALALLISSLALAVGITGFYAGSNISASECSAELKASEERVQKLKATVPGSIEKISNISGTVLKVGDGKVTIKSSLTSPIEKLPEERVILISNITEVLLRKAKDVDVYNKEMLEFAKRSGEAGGGEGENQNLLPFVESKIGITEIKEGDLVQVESLGGASIKSEESFEASKVIVQR